MRRSRYRKKESGDSADAQESGDDRPEEYQIQKIDLTLHRLAVFLAPYAPFGG